MKTKSLSQQPSTWLIVALAGISQLSETIYTPLLPSIEQSLHVHAGIVEYTLTIYFLGFTLGTLFFGKISDYFGRKPSILGGLFIFALGCFVCSHSQSIIELMSGRLVQSFGASVGSVLCQAVVRDALHGAALGKMYSFVGTALSIFPIIGPLIGVSIAKYFGWAAIFFFLMLFGLSLIILTALILKETHHQDNRHPISLFDVAYKLLKDKKVMALAVIVAGANGIAFSYFGEGSFYLMKFLKLSPNYYGLTFIFLAVGTFLGGIFSWKLHDTSTTQQIMGYGIKIIFGASLFFSMMILLQTSISLSQNILIGITIFSQTSLMFGICISATNALALALVDYKWCVGTASSLFGFFYYTGVSLVTFGMGTLHNGTLFPMPLYFLAISIIMLLARRGVPI